MGFQVSPGVSVTEIDLTTIVPAVATTQGAVAGVFRWGPVEQRVLVDTEATLAARFGKPNSNTAETWFTAANFLGYGNILYVTRAANTTDANTANNNASYNALALANTLAVNSSSANLLLSVVKNQDDYNSKSSFPADVNFVAKYPGAIGNSLRISMCLSPNAFSNTISLTSNSTGALGNSSVCAIAFSLNTNTATVTIQSADGTQGVTNSISDFIKSKLTLGDYITAGNNLIGTQNLKISSFSNTTYPGSAGNPATFTINFYDTYRLSTAYSSNSVSRKWEYFNIVDSAPTQSSYVNQFGNSAAIDEVHLVVVDENGDFSGVPGTVLERFAHLSRATDAKSPDGATLYYKTVLNNQSQYVWYANDGQATSANSQTIASVSSTIAPYTVSFYQGADGQSESNIAIGDLTRAYNKYASVEDIDVSMILAGKSNGYTLVNWLIDNIAEQRKDCMVFFSPQYTDVVNNVGNERDAILAFRNNMNRSSSYAVMDSGYKQMYDRYNDLYRFIPLNGDVAGLCVRTEVQRDAWFSPAGFNRGQIKNIVKLAYNPTKSDRDILYPQGVNPVVSFPGQGTVLYGDKTLLSKPSAFDRINVRRLFIVLEKAISTASKFTLFELNDQFTRAQFVSLVTPFLRDIKGRRGITDFLVVCDDTNNTPERIDRNEFWGDIYIKPARSINFIQLNFVAVRTGVQFSTVVGQF
jgi:hypothetical protein